MKVLLVALVLALWHELAPGLERTRDARAIAVALVDAVLEEAAAAPALGSHVEDLAVGAYWAARESSLDAGAVADRGAARGPWQLHGATGQAALGVQARAWLSLLHTGARTCPASPTAILWGGCAVDLRPYGTSGTSAQAGARRVKRARALLSAAMVRVSP